MPRLSLTTLGTLNVTLDSKTVTALESDKARALLVYLAVKEAQPHRREKLASLLWPDLPETHARQNLRQTLYNLRGALGDRPEVGLSPREPILLVTPQCIQFNAESDYWLDASLFSDLIARSDSHNHRWLESCGSCMTDLGEALRLYRGDFLAGFCLGDCLEFEEWVLFQREHLRRRVMVALTLLAGYHEGRGEIEQALDYTHRGVQMDPLWEGGQRRLMRLLALDGQHNAALAQYRTCRRMLADELDIGPARATQALYTRIHAEAQGTALTGDLPTHLTPFVGRQGELAELRSMLLDPDIRLVNVMGPGGSGKTRLALEATRGLRYDFEDGTYLVPLSPLSSQEALVPAVAKALGFTFREQERGSSGRPPRGLNAQLADYLRGKHTLLIFDSFETLLECAGWLVELLRGAPHLKALVTSRAGLNVKGEQRFSLAGLHYPRGEDFVDAAQHSAVELFITAARRAKPDFEPSAAQLSDIARICRLLEGMPLGLLLAAAWIGTYNTAEITAQISSGLDFLVVDWTDVPTRQLSLRATFDYSWRLLGTRERDICAQLSVFRGSFTREAAKRVAGASGSSLRELVDKCMLDVAGEGRFRMHDMVRQYSLERLSRVPDMDRGVRQRHCAYYFDKLQRWKEDLKGPGEMAALAEMDVEISNLQAAWEWAVANEDIERLDQGLKGLGLYYDLRARNAEARLNYDRALEVLEGLPDTQENRLRRLDTIIRYVASTWRADLNAAQARLVEAEQLIDTLPELDEARQARFRFYKGRLHYGKNETREAIECYRQVLPMAKKLGEPEILSITSSAIGQVLAIQGIPAKAEPLLREAIPLFEEMGDWAEWIRASGFHGMEIISLGEYAAGIEEIQRGLAKAQELDYLSEASLSYLFLGYARLKAGDYPGSIQAYSQSLETARQASEFTYIFIGSIWLGLAEARAGFIETAIASLAQAQAALEEIGGMIVYVDTFAAIRAEVALRQGRVGEALDLSQQAVDIAQRSGSIETAGLAQRVWGKALAEMNPPRWDEAEEHLAESLRLYEEAQARLEVAHTHVARGEVCRARGDLKAARAHWEVAAAQWDASGCPVELERTQALMDGLAQLSTKPATSHDG